MELSSTAKERRLVYLFLPFFFFFSIFAWLDHSHFLAVMAIIGLGSVFKPQLDIMMNEVSKKGTKTKMGKEIKAACPFHGLHLYI